MPITTPTFRVFVSSTFDDLKAERDALQRDVFPRLRKLCESLGAHFQAIDLRWGVRDEAALDQRTMDICLREIRRCQATGVKPNFIVLLGDRYGWQPLPSRIPAAEWDALRPHLRAHGPLAETWYRLDENAVPTEYVLQPRSGEFADSAAWGAMEQTLHGALAAAARPAAITGKGLSKYEDSATHQEILAGLGATEEDRRHVFGFFRRPKGRAVFGVFQKPVAVPDPRLQVLKSLVPHSVEFAHGDIKTLCEAVYSRLAGVIEDEARRFEDRPALEVEIESHDRFAEDRARIFRGRRKALVAIADYLCGGERRPLVLHGSSGSGKSAAMAKASGEAKGAVVIRRFIGVTPDASTGPLLLRSLCLQLSNDGGLANEMPSDFQSLAATFHTRLASATAERPIVVFLDRSAE